MLTPTTGTSRRQANHNPIAVFDPLPWQIAPWRDKSPLLLLTGSAGGGKSRLAGEKIHGYCLKYPGSTALIARKAKTSMSGGTILFMRRKVVGSTRAVRWVDSPKFRFEYANGSILQFVGLLDDNARDNLKSIGQDGAVDIGWFEEGTQFEEEDLSAMSARMRGKAAPWRQLIFTTNPDAPLHWIKRRLIDGAEATVYFSSAADNFHNPADYTAWLATLSGVEYQRLVLGQWIQASGLVYDVWSDGPTDGNVTTDAEYIDGGGIILWGVDDGYTGKLDPRSGQYTGDSHPRVFGLYQLRPDGSLNRFAESYAVGMLSDDHIKLVQALPYPIPDFAVVDKSAAELKGRLHAAGVYTRNSPSDVEESIKELRSALAKDRNGHRRLHVHPRCTHFRAEMASYRRDSVSGKPIKQFDHGPDECRYVVWSQRFEQ
jgi:Phage terminase large subunit